MKIKEYFLKFWTKQQHEKSFLLSKYYEQSEFNEFLYDTLQDIKNSDLDNKELLIQSFENVLNYFDTEKEILKDLSK